MSCVDGAGAAARRRERRLRATLRHERQSIAMALAEAHRRSAPKVGAVPHDAPRSQKTASAVGERPGILEEPEPPWEVATDGHVAALAPSVARPALAAPTADGVDAAALSFLVAQSLAQQEKEKKEEEEQAKVKRNEEEKEESRMKRINEKVRVELPVIPKEREAWRRSIASSSSSSSGKMRKWKKRRKRKLPLNSSRPRFAAQHLGRYGPEGHFAATQRPLPLPALYALGNLDFLRATGIWYLLVRCLSRRRSTGKFGVFWEMPTRNYFYGPLYLAVTCAVFSTTLCI